MIDLLLPALIAGIAVALVAGPLGCLMVWRRMAFFGDTLSHGALLGVALGVLLSIHPVLAVALSSCLIALGLYALQSRRDLAADTLLSVLAHTALAFGILAVSMIEGVRPNMTALLFGDILFVTWTDALVIALGSAGLLVVIALTWRGLLNATVQEDLAQLEGVRTAAVRLLLMIMMALTVAFAMRIVGLLLVTALLIVPAAAARRWARDPEPMAMLAAVIGVMSVIGGITASWLFDIPAGPAMVVVAAVFFLLGTYPAKR